MKDCLISENDIEVLHEARKILKQLKKTERKLFASVHKEKLHWTDYKKYTKFLSDLEKMDVLIYDDGEMVLRV